MNFAIPSYRRPRCRTVDKYPGVVFIDRHDEAAYRDVHPDAEYHIVPDEWQGSSSRIRNYIQDWYFSRDEPVVMLDDDIHTIGWLHNTETGKGIYEKRELSFEQVDAAADQMAQCCHDAGFRMFGCNTTWQYVSYAANVPFSTHAFIGGPFLGMLPNELRYDERISLKNDYDIVCQHIARYGGVWRCNMMYYSAEMGCQGNTDVGGVSLERNREEEARQLDILCQKWGAWIRRPKGKDINPILNIPIKGL